MDHFPNHTLGWTVSSSEQVTDQDGNIVDADDVLTFINGAGVLSVWRYDNRSYLDVQARMLFGPRHAGTYRVSLVNPATSVAGITFAFTENQSAVHRGAQIGIQTTVHWGGEGGGHPPLPGAGPRGVIFSLENDAGGGEFTVAAGDNNTAASLVVSRDQMPGVTGLLMDADGNPVVDEHGSPVAPATGLFVRATAMYAGPGELPFSILIPIPIENPEVQSVTVTGPYNEAGVLLTGAGAGVHRGERNQFRAVVHGVGFPFQDINWSVVPHGAGGTAFLPSTIVDENGWLTVDENCRHSIPITVQAASNSVHNVGSGEDTGTTAILTPVITAIQIVGGNVTMQRDTTRRFYAEITSRGNPDDFVIEWDVEGESTSQTEVTRLGFGLTGDLFLPPNEASPSFTLRAQVDGSDLVPSTITVFVAAGGHIPGDWRTVAIGIDHTLALSWNNHLYAWGRNQWGRLGNGHVFPNTGVVIPIANSALTNPENVDLLVTRPASIGGGHVNLWRDISGGNHHSIGIRQDGTLWAWGSNALGQLGARIGTLVVTEPTVGNVRGTVAGHDGVTRHVQVQSAPMPVEAARRFTWRSISAGMDHNVGIKVDGTLYSFGNWANGRLGRELADMHDDVDGYGGEIRPHWAPGRITVDGLDDYGWAMASAGGMHGAALRYDGRLFTWGGNAHGQVGPGAAANQLLPIEVHHPTGGTWIYVGANNEGTLAIDSNHVLWTWGNNVSGALGRMVDRHGVALDNPATVTGGSVPVPEPGPVPHPTPGREWRRIATSGGSQHAAAIDDLGHVYTWGRNHAGQLGWGAAYRRFDTPPHPNTSANFGGFFRPVNDLGHLNPPGGPALTPQLETRPMLATPRQPMPGIVVQEALAGRFYTIIIDTQGRMFGWGDNRFGQIGIGESFWVWNQAQVIADGPFPRDMALPTAGFTIFSPNNSHQIENNRIVFNPVQIFRY